MTIKNEILAFLNKKHDATTEQVSAVVEAEERGALHELRRLAIAGRITKTVKREFATGKRITHWKINRAWAPPPVSPQSWLSALEWKPGK